MSAQLKSRRPRENECYAHTTSRSFDRPPIFGYEQEIAKELIRTGHLVDFLPDRPFDSPFMKAVLRFRPELGGHRACDRFFAQHMEQCGRSDYSTIPGCSGRRRHYKHSSEIAECVPESTARIPYMGLHRKQTVFKAQSCSF